MNILLKSRRSGLALVFILVTAILLTFWFSGTPVTGQTIFPTAPPQNTQTGQVVSIAADGNSVTIQPGDLSAVTVQVNPSTVYNKASLAPKDLSGLLNLVEAFMGQGRLSTDALSTLVAISQATQSAGFSDIAVGDILAVEPATANPAQSVLIVKIPCIRGTITAVTGNSFTIATSDNKTVTLNWNAGTRFILEGVSSLAAGLNANVVYDKTANSALIAVISAPVVTPSPTTK